MKKKQRYISVISASVICICISTAYIEKNKSDNQYQDKRPNILFVISDDQSYPYASIYGTTGLQTPAFDEIAKSGILFTNAFVAAPQCSPSRAAILTGRNIWQLEEAGTHSSYFPKKYSVFTDELERSGYWIGYTGKPWGPGNWKDAGWKRNPVGPAFNKKELVAPTNDISNLDYFENFAEFYKEKKDNTPFFFWCGPYEPHRNFTVGSGKKAGKDIMKSFVPPFLPSDTVVRSDIADYDLEIEWFDQQLGKMISFLRQKGELENTIIVVTSDNGMAFPSAKANLMEYGTHVPLAISWPAKVKGGRICNDLVSLIDLAPTFLQVAGIDSMRGVTGKSLTNLLLNKKTGPHRTYVLTGRERHTHARPDNLGYPSRAIRTENFLYIMNIKPELWPMGDPQIGTGNNNGYKDIDDPSPTKEFMLKYKDDFPSLFKTGFEKRPADQLFDIKKDPGCTVNLADDPKYVLQKNELKEQLKKLLTEQEDPRMLGYGDIFDSYPRFGSMRNLPGFKEEGKYNPAFEPKGPKK
jgi:uncharacterized sulfatase